MHQRVRKICTYFCFLKREHKFNCIDIVENIKYSKLARATVGIMPDWYALYFQFVRTFWTVYFWSRLHSNSKNYYFPCKLEIGIRIRQWPLFFCNELNKRGMYISLPIFCSHDCRRMRFFNYSERTSTATKQWPLQGSFIGSRSQIGKETSVEIDQEACFQLSKLAPHLLLLQLPKLHFHSQQLPDQELHHQKPLHSQCGQVGVDPAISTGNSG